MHPPSNRVQQSDLGRCGGCLVAHESDTESPVLGFGVQPFQQRRDVLGCQGLENSSGLLENQPVPAGLVAPSEHRGRLSSLRARQEPAKGRPGSLCPFAHSSAGPFPPTAPPAEGLEEPLWSHQPRGRRKAARRGSKWGGGGEAHQPTRQCHTSGSEAECCYYAVDLQQANEGVHRDPPTRWGPDRITSDLGPAPQPTLLLEPCGGCCDPRLQSWTQLQVSSWHSRLGPGRALVSSQPRGRGESEGLGRGNSRIALRKEAPLPRC